MAYFLFPVISLSTVLEHNIIIPPNKLIIKKTPCKKAHKSAGNNVSLLQDM